MFYQWKRKRKMKDFVKLVGMRKIQSPEGNTGAKKVLDIGVGCEDMNDQSLTSPNEPSENVV